MIAVLVPPDLVHTHCELVIPVGFHRLKVLPLFFLGCDIDGLYRHLAFSVFLLGAISLEHRIEFFGRNLLKADIGHVHGFVVGVCRQLVLPVLVVQVGNVIVADTGGFVVLAAEKHTGLC